MKTIRLMMVGVAVALAGLCLAPREAEAQQYQRTAFPAALATTAAALDGGTNVVPALKTNLYVIPLTRYGDVGLDVGFVAHVSGSTSNLVWNIWESSTTNKPTTGAKYTLAQPATSTTAVRWVTNYTVGPNGYLIVEVGNTNASGAMTNVGGYYVLKPSRFGQ